MIKISRKVGNIPKNLIYFFKKAILWLKIFTLSLSIYLWCISFEGQQHIFSLKTNLNTLSNAHMLNKILTQYFGQRPLSRKNTHFDINYIVTAPPFCTCFPEYYLILYLIETPFNAFANRADPDQAALVRAA